MDWKIVFDLSLLAIAAYIQNMAFTWTSRSRNSGDPSYHRWAAYCSNGIWLICHFLVWKQIWTGFETGAWWRLGIAAVVYMIATAEGSVRMMKILLKKEKGKHRVGAKGN